MTELLSAAFNKQAMECWQPLLASAPHLNLHANLVCVTQRERADTVFQEDNNTFRVSGNVR